MTNISTPPYEQLQASALSRPMRMLIALPREPIPTLQAVEAAGFEDMPLGKASKLMSQLSGRGLVKWTGPGCYQITPLGLKVRARLRQQIYGATLENEDR